MTDYISREEALMAVTRAKLPDATPDGVPIANGKRSVTDCVRRIKAIPSADVAPVRRGKWSMKFMDDRHSHFYGLFRFTCSACGYYEDKDYSDSMDNVNYCPNCGAKMEVDNGTT